MLLGFLKMYGHDLFQVLGIWFNFVFVFVRDWAFLIKQEAGWLVGIIYVY